MKPPVCCALGDCAPRSAAGEYRRARGGSIAVCCVGQWILQGSAYTEVLGMRIEQREIEPSSCSGSWASRQ